MGKKGELSMMEQKANTYWLVQRCYNGVHGFSMTAGAAIKNLNNVMEGLDSSSRLFQRAHSLQMKIVRGSELDVA